MKLMHLGVGQLQSTPQYAYVHDAYHPQPGQPGEGKPGSGLLYTIRESAPKTARTVVHAIAMDSIGGVAGWHLLSEAEGPVWESPDKQTRWQLVLDKAAGVMYVREHSTNRQWKLST